MEDQRVVLEGLAVGVGQVVCDEEIVTNHHCVSHVGKRVLVSEQGVALLKVEVGDVVGATSKSKAILALTTSEDVSAVVAVQHVVTLAPEDGVVTLAAFDAVGGLATSDEVVFAGAFDGALSQGSSECEVGTVWSRESVLSGGAVSGEGMVKGW